MLLQEYVRSVYPIKDKVKMIRNNPLQRIAKMDDLPFDAIRFIDGEYVKVVELNEAGEFIPVLELIGLTPEELNKQGNEDLKQVYDVYMEKVEVADFDLESLMEMSHTYRAAKKKKEEQLSKCM